MLGFRVWDGSNVYAPCNDEYMCCPDGDLYRVNNCGEVSLIWKSVIAMQSTGLKDCNDVEIFEGDILELTVIYMNDNGPDEPDVIEKMNYIVENATAAIIDLTHKETIYYSYQNAVKGEYKFFSDAKIIGNIYSNPELLEK